MSTSVPPELLREVIREVVREVIREVVAEEIAAAAAAGGLARAGSSGGRRPAEPAPRPTGASAPSAGPARAGDPVALQRGALTERHVRAVGKAGTITIGKAVVITPLARERARAMGVEIIRIEG